VTNDDDAVTQMRLHQECWELLPWVVNGRLSGAEATRVTQHLQQCTRCSVELQAQQQLCDALRREDPVLLAPQAALRKLWQRIDTQVPGCDEPSPALDAMSQDGMPASAAHPADADAPRISRSMRIALAAQTLLIVGLVGWSGWQAFERWQAPRFVTLTAPNASAQRGVVRVVFAADMSLGDMSELLRSIHAEILAGPSPAGVFTLGLPAETAADAVARGLRADPHVRFAESLVSPLTEQP